MSLALVRRLLAAAAASVVGWVVALVRFRGWIAEGDGAAFQLRLERMLAGHIPLTGAYSRLEFHHPGPLREWLFGTLYALAGHRAAVLPATVLVLNVVLLAAGCVAAYRAGRAPALAAAGAGALCLAAGMGWQLHDPWNPYTAMFAGFAAFWGTAAAIATRGKHWVLALVAASLHAQAHVAGALTGLAATVATLVILYRRGPRWAVGGAALVGALWIGPLVDLLRGPDSNVAHVTDGASGDRIGLLAALRVTSGLADPWSLARGQFHDPHAGLPSTASAWIAVAAVLALAAAVALARSSTQVIAGVGLGALVLTIASYALITEPVFPYLFTPLVAGVAAPLMVAVHLVAGRLPARAEWAVASAVGAGAALAAVPGLVSIEPMVHSPLETSLRGAVAARVDPGRQYNITRMGVWGAGTDAETALYVQQSGGEPRADWYHLDLPPAVAGAPVLVIAMGAALDCLGTTLPPAARVAYGVSVNVAVPVGVFAVEPEQWPAAATCDVPA